MIQPAAPLPQQVVRDRLLARLRSSPVTLVEAGAGYGKSVLAWQHQRDLGVATAFVPLGPPDDDPAVLVGSLRRALRGSRLSDLAAATDGAAPATALERLLDALAETSLPLLVVLDDAHHLRGAEAAALVLRLARGLPAPHRLLVSARRVAAPLEPLRVLAAVTLDTAALEFTGPEAAALTEGYRGRPPSGWELRVLLEATRGWATALVLAASSSAPVDGLARVGPGELTIAPLLDPIIRQLQPPDRDAAVQLAHLPMLSAELADLVGSEGTLHRIITAGLPVARGPTGWSEMPGPVSAYLAAQRPLTPQTASIVAGVYEHQGEPLAAVRTLLAGALPAEAARTLAALAPARAEDIGLGTLRDLVAELPPSAVREHPRVLLHLARVAEMTHRNDVRGDALAQASRIVADQADRADPVFRREVDAECARDLMWDERTRAQARTLAQAVIAGAHAEEITARARALDVLGRLASWFSDDGVLPEAETLLLASARLAGRVGQHTWQAQALVGVGSGFYFALCRYERALDTLSEALAQLPARSLYRVTVLSFYADVLVELGRSAEAEASIEEMREIGQAYREEWAIAYAGWSEAALASYAGDAARTVRAVLETEAHRDVWFDQPAGVEFLVCAVDYLDRVGEHAMARERLAQARQRMAGIERPVRVFGSAMLGRSGDPDEAAAAIAATLAEYNLEPQERWPLLLMQAHAAARRGDPRAGALAAAVFDLCLELGIPEGPLRRERRVARALLPLAVAAGSRAAAALSSGPGAVTLTLLGRFEIRRDGMALELPPGRPAKAVRAVAAQGGRMHAEELIEILWPDTGVEAGRNRLRNLLSRLRMAAGDVLIRDEEKIIFPYGAALDSELFASQAEAALAARSAGEVSRCLGLARSAVSRYAGDLLPDDRYEDWAIGPRERLRTLHVALLDLLAADAAGRGDVDEAVRLLRRATDYAPHDEDRFVRLARMLASQGHTGSARSTLERARSHLAELGVPPSRPLILLEGELTRQAV